MKITEEVRAFAGVEGDRRREGAGSRMQEKAGEFVAGERRVYRRARFRRAPDAVCCGVSAEEGSR